MFQYLLLGSFLFLSVYGSSPTTIKQIQIENLNNNYKGKKIRFVDFIHSQNVIGILLEITDEEIILSIKDSRSTFQHSNINCFYLEPEGPDYIIASGISILSAAAHYLALIITYQKTDQTHRVLATSTGFLLGSYIGKSTFLRPIKVDINLNSF